MKILLAFSGGLDSTCLLTMLLRDELAEFSNINLHVVHINHGLNHHSEQWVEHCQKLCGQHELPFQQINLSIDTGNGASLEAEARRQRYQAFTGLMSEGDILLTAHHQNDQAETFLLQALRGAGVKGLAAMPFKKRFAQGWHIRPLLSMTRQELEQYAAQHQLNWVEDESNADSRFDRNLLRNQIFPLLRQRWPSVHQSLRQSAQYCAQADELIHDLAVIDLPTCADDQQTLTISKLLELSTARQKNVIRFWLQQQKCRVPAGIFIQRILDEVMVARVDSNPQVTWSGGEVRRFQGRLYALAALPLDNSNQYTWQGMDDLDLDTHLLSKQSRLGGGACGDQIT